MALVACPFCRELFGAEEAERCPNCDLRLVPLESLPPSAEALAEEFQDAPIDQPFGFLFLGAWRGFALAANAVGLLLFFVPWFVLERPDAVSLSGADLARSNAPWLFGGALGFALNVPLLLSRRTLRQLDGVRGIAVTFALMTACEVIVLVAKPPLESSYFSARLSLALGLWLSLGASLVAAFSCLRLGQAAIGELSGAARRARSAHPRARPERPQGVQSREDSEPPDRLLH